MYYVCVEDDMTTVYTVDAAYGLDKNTATLTLTLGSLTEYGYDHVRPQGTPYVMFPGAVDLPVFFEDTAENLKPRA